MFLSKLLALLVAPVISASSAGVDIDYDGEINIYTGEPASSEETENRDVVTVSDNCEYSYEQDMFTYYVPTNNAMRVSSSVADRMITTKPVSITYESDVSVGIYLNGEHLENADASELSDYGSYSVVVAGNDSEHQLLSFMIIPEKTGMVSSYQLPDGFEAVEVAVDDEIQAINDKNVISMKKEGEYLISYRCTASKVEYALRVSIDHTPPAVTLGGVNDGKAKGKVTVSGIEEDDSVSMKKDGKEYKLAKDGVIKIPGKYEITVTDEAGNVFSEAFEIRFYFDRQGLLFGILAAAVVVSAVVYMVLARKRLRIR